MLSETKIRMSVDICIQNHIVDVCLLLFRLIKSTSLYLLNPAGEFGGAAAADEEDEDALMQRALEMSMREMLSVNESSSGGAAGTESKTEEEEGVNLFFAFLFSLQMVNPVVKSLGTLGQSVSYAMKKLCFIVFLFLFCVVSTFIIGRR